MEISGRDPEAFKSLDVDRIMVDVIDSGCLGASQRQRDLLRFLLEEFKAGRSAKVKAYSIAVDILGRPESFDGAIDPIVRAEMHRLRKNLKQYNLSRRDYEITIPRGQFTPKVCLIDAKTKRHITVTSKRSLLLLAVLLSLIALVGYFQFQYFNSSNTSDNSGSISMKFSLEMGEITPKIEQSKVALFEQRFLAKNSSGLFVEIVNPDLADYKIRYDISWDTSSSLYKLYIKLYRYDDALVWSETKDLNADNFAHDLEKYLNFISVEWFEGWGVVHLDFYHNLKQQRLPEANLFKCVIDTTYFLVGKLTQEDITAENLLGCLDVSAVGANEEKSTIHALRAWVYLDGHRGYIKLEGESLFQMAEQELELASALHRTNFMYLSKVLLLEQERRPNRDLDKIKRILFDINGHLPDHHNLLTTQAIAYGYILGDWEKAQNIQESLSGGVKGQEVPIYHTFLAASLVRKEYQKAEEYAEKMTNVDAPIIDALMFSAYCYNNNMNIADQYKLELIAHGFRSEKAYLNFISSRLYEPKLQQTLLNVFIKTNCKIDN